MLTGSEFGNLFHIMISIAGQMKIIKNIFVCEIQEKKNQINDLNNLDDPNSLKTC